MSTTARSAEPVVSIVIEWENIQLAEADRCSAMLTELMRQIEAYSGPPGTVPGISRSS